MKRLVSIANAVEITNNRVKPFVGECRYLATGDLAGDAITELVSVDYKSKPSRADLLVRQGEIIVARMQATNKVFLIDKSNKDLIVSTGFLTLAPKNEFDPDYLFHYFRSEIFQRQKDRYCSGATQKAINNGAFKKLKIPYPPIKEQKNIAKILGHSDSIRQHRKQSIQFLDELLRATFFDMFGDPVKNTKRFKINTIKDVCETRLGKMLDSKKQTGRNARPYLRNANVQWDSFDLDEVFQMDFDDADRAEFQLKKGDILVCEGGEIGRTAIWEEQIKECYFQKALHRIRLDTSVILPEYFLYLMWFYAHNGGFKDYVSTATISHLTGEKLRRIKIPIPPIVMQRKYSSFYRCVKSTKLKMDKSSAELDNQFNALTQKAFGGAENV